MARDRFRRGRDGNKSSAQFAATSIDLTRPDDISYANAIIPMSRAGSQSAWKWHDAIGEIHYAVTRSSRIGGYANLRVHKLEKNGEIGDPVTSGLAGEIGDMLYSPYGGQRGLLERFLTLMKVPADSYLIQCPDSSGGFDGLDFLSADELRFAEPGSLKPGQTIERITMPGGTLWGNNPLAEQVKPGDFVGRVWRPSARFVDVPDSPLKALDTSCELLHLLTLGIRATLLSRLASNGIFYVPAEANDARSAAPDGQVGEFHHNKVINELIKAAVYSYTHQGEAAASLPVFISGPAAYAESFKHIIMDQALAETDMKLRAELIDRILQGLDVQPTQIKGAQDANHWGSWSATDDEMKVTIRPDIETACWALTRLFLWKRMADEGRKSSDIMRYVVWYDLDDATSHMNIAEDARQLRDRLLIGPTATRRMNGVGERDAPTAVEYIQALGYKIGDPYLATFGMSEAERFDWEKIGSIKTGPAPASPASDPQVGPGQGNPGGPGSSKSDAPTRLRPAN